MTNEWTCDCIGECDDCIERGCDCYTTHVGQNTHA